MKKSARFTWLLLFLILFFTSTQGQTRKAPAPTPTPAAKTAPKPAGPTFDTLLAAETYGVYSEVRGVGQLIRSQGLNNLIEPYVKLAKPAKEFQTLVRWLNLRADALMTSRMFCASLPIKPNVPQFLCAVEFPSVEEAQKFEPQIRTFLPKMMPTPTPEKLAAPEKSGTAPNPPQQPAAPATPPYVIKQTGSLVIVSSTAVDLKALRPANTKLLMEDAHFRTTRDRFNTEQIFLHFDLKSLMRRSEEEQRKAQELYEEERKKAEAAAAEKKARGEADEAKAGDEDDDVSTPDTNPASQSDEASQTNPNGESTVTANVTQGSPPLALMSLAGAFFGGQSKWPEAIGGAISFDEDSYNLRVLLLNEADAKGLILPFFPNLVSGPAITLSAASIMPAKSDLFVSLSVDYTATHDSMVASAISSHDVSIRSGTQMVSHETGSNNEASPFAAYEKLLGIKIKDDLIPLLGNEIALSLRGLDKVKAEVTEKSKTDQTGDAAAKPPEISSPIPIIAISVRDKEGVKKLLPRIIEGMGLKGASLLAQTERREDTEIVSYVDAFAYAFIGDFFVVSTDVAAVRSTVDAYLKNETLGSDSRFRNFTRWQPRQVLGQVYMPSHSLDEYGVNIGALQGLSDEMQMFLTNLGPVTEPVTYALSNEGTGPLHELHVPRNVMMAFIAGLSGGASGGGPQNMALNEMSAQSMLRTFAAAQETYKATTGNGSFGSVEDLIKADLVGKEFPSSNGYNYEFKLSHNGFEATAIPNEYGKTGKQSFFIDQSSILRGGDHGGGSATISDKPVQ
jgi:hypothetical protein